MQVEQDYFIKDHMKGSITYSFSQKQPYLVVALQLIVKPTGLFSVYLSVKVLIFGH